MASVSLRQVKGTVHESSPACVCQRVEQSEHRDDTYMRASFMLFIPHDIQSTNLLFRHWYLLPPFPLSCSFLSLRGTVYTNNTAGRNPFQRQQKNGLHTFGTDSWAP
jgi:hypothetical protein